MPPSVLLTCPRRNIIPLTKRSVSSSTVCLRSYFVVRTIARKHFRDRTGTRTLSSSESKLTSELPSEAILIEDMSSRKSMPAAIPRPSASLIVVNERNEVLLVQRNPKSRSFGGMHVFPGGNADPKQDTSPEVTAIRETFEETGVLLAYSSPSSKTEHEVIKKIPDLSDAAFDEARKQIHGQQASFQHFLEEFGLVLDTGALLPFTQWVTPAEAPRRFHAHFFITFLPSTSQISPSSDSLTSTFSSTSLYNANSSSNTITQHHHRLPTPDGGLEIVSTSFLHPSTALDLFKVRKIQFMPPQFYILSTLNQIFSDSGDSPYKSTKAQRDRISELSQGPFGRMVINPRALVGEDQGVKEGRRILTYEGDETRGGKEGQKHRSLVLFDKKGVPLEIELLRNFDIFTEIEEYLSPATDVTSPSKAKL